MLTLISSGMGWSGLQNIFTSISTISYYKVFLWSSAQRPCGNEVVSKHRVIRKHNVILFKSSWQFWHATDPKTPGLTRRASAHPSTKISTSSWTSPLERLVDFSRMLPRGFHYFKETNWPSRDSVGGKPWVDRGSPAAMSDFWKANATWYPSWDPDGMIVSKISSFPSESPANR
jgi:hypothetical protein